MLNQPKSALLFATKNSGWYSLLESISCWTEVILQSDSITSEGTCPSHLSSQSPLKGILWRPPFYLASLSSLSILTEPPLPSFIDTNMPQGLCTCCCIHHRAFAHAAAPPFGSSHDWLFVCYSELTLLDMNDIPAECSFLSTQFNTANTQHVTGVCLLQSTSRDLIFCHLLICFWMPPYSLKNINCENRIFSPHLLLVLSVSYWCLVKHKCF